MDNLGGAGPWTARRKPCSTSRIGRRWPTGETCTDPLGDRPVAGRGAVQREPFQVAVLNLDAAALDALWDELGRMDTHFWKEESLRRYMENRTFGIRRDAAQQGAGRNRVVRENRATGPAFTAGGWRRCGTSWCRRQRRWPGSRRGHSSWYRLQVGGPGFCLALDAVNRVGVAGSGHGAFLLRASIRGHCNPRPIPAAAATMAPCRQIPDSAAPNAPAVIAAPFAPGRVKSRQLQPPLWRAKVLWWYGA